MNAGFLNHQPYDQNRWDGLFSGAMLVLGSVSSRHGGTGKCYENHTVELFFPRFTRLAMGFLLGLGVGWFMLCWGIEVKQLNGQTLKKNHRMDSFCRKKNHMSKEVIGVGFIARTYQNNSFIIGTLTVGQYTFGSEGPSTVAGLGFVS